MNQTLSAYLHWRTLRREACKSYDVTEIDGHFVKVFGLDLFSLNELFCNWSGRKTSSWHPQCDQEEISEEGRGAGWGGCWSKLRNQMQLGYGQIVLRTEAYCLRRPHDIERAEWKQCCRRRSEPHFVETTRWLVIWRRRLRASSSQIIKLNNTLEIFCKEVLLFLSLPLLIDLFFQSQYPQDCWHSSPSCKSCCRKC